MWQSRIKLVFKNDLEILLKVIYWYSMKIIANQFY